MPTPDREVSLDVDFSGGYFPSAQNLSPEELQRTIKAGSNCWLRAKGKLDVAKGLLEVSATNVGARIFAADIQRAVIAGGLNGDILPFAGLARYANAALFFLSENTSAQVYLDEVAVAGLTTSSTPGRLRVAIPNGLGGYNVFDAGFAKPPLVTGDVIVGVSSRSVPKNMAGSIGVALVPWRIATNAQGPPSNIIYNKLSGSGTSVIRIGLPSAVSGQDGWIYAGTRWNDQGGTLRVVRYVRITARGTFTATNGSPNITAGVGTSFTRDFYEDDVILIDATQYQIASITSDTTLTLTSNFTGGTGAGKTATVLGAAASWYDGELGALINLDVVRPPRAAGVHQYAGRLLLWGVPEPDSPSPTGVTGSVILVAPDGNPEHVILSQLSSIVTDSGGDLLRALGGDGPLYLMTTKSLEVASLGGPADKYLNVRIVAEPGFEAATNGCLYKDYFYGYSNRPLRTRAKENIDVEFGEAVWSDMEDWNGARVIVTVDPDNAAVLYIHDDGAATTVLPWMTQLEQWGPPLNFSARIIDAAVVSGKLYVTYLSGGNYRSNEWEGGAGIGGTRFAASQYYDPNMLKSNRLKTLIPVGKLGSVSVYAATADAEVPDVSDLGAAAATFMLSDTASKREPAIKTNIRGDAYAYRVDFASNDGAFDKLIARGLPEGEDR